jgi:predicted DCC family thiol-disulfide oxidoreductase YuxK
MKVYFDGGCRVCSREIDFYRRKRGSEKIQWVDISKSNFDARSEGLDPKTIMRVFHVRDERGNLITGVPAFIEIWKRLPDLQFWESLTHVPGARTAMGLGYSVFMRVRPYLPRRKPEECESGHCRR